MPEFLQLVSVDEARGALLAGTAALTEEETIPTGLALGRVTSRDIASPADSPSFRRSEVDGYAVRSHDTHAASARRTHATAVERPGALLSPGGPGHPGRTPQTRLGGTPGKKGSNGT